MPCPDLLLAWLSGKMTSISVLVYLIEINGKAYYVPPKVILTIPKAEEKARLVFF